MTWWLITDIPNVSIPFHINMFGKRQFIAECHTKRRYGIDTREPRNGPRWYDDQAPRSWSSNNNFDRFCSIKCQVISLCPIFDVLNFTCDWVNVKSWHYQICVVGIFACLLLIYKQQIPVDYLLKTLLDSCRMIHSCFRSLWSEFNCTNHNNYIHL